MRFLITFIFCLLVCAILWFCLMWGQMGNPSKMSQWIFDAYEKKQKISRSIENNKVVIVAGSNALFGIDSKMLSNTFGLPVLNDSVNAGIELPSVLFMAQKVINKGDIVIMPLEYPMYYYDGTAGIQMVDYLLSRIPELFAELTLKEQLYLYWHVTFERIYNGYFQHSNKNVKKGLYGIHNIDMNGDQIHTELSQRKTWMADALNKQISKPVRYSESFDPNALGWQYLQYFILWCEKRDVNIVFMPSTLMWDESYSKNPEEKWFYTHIADEIRKQGWHFVGDPYDYMYEKEYYFDTRYHLINIGRKMRTKRMIDDLKAAGIFSKR